MCSSSICEVFGLFCPHSLPANADIASVACPWSCSVDSFYVLRGTCEGFNPGAQAGNEQ